jgi:hypothetical protein
VSSLPAGGGTRRTDRISAGYTMSYDVAHGA